MVTTRKRKIPASPGSAGPPPQDGEPVASTSSAAQLDPSPPPSKRAKSVAPSVAATEASNSTKRSRRQVNAGRRKKKNNKAGAADTMDADEGGFVLQAAEGGSAMAAGGADEDGNDTPNTTPDHIELDDDEASTVMARSVAAGREGGDKTDKGKAKQHDAGERSGRAAAMQEDMKVLKEEIRLLKDQVAGQEEALAVHRDFVQAMRSNFSCSICLETVVSPYALACGHIFCHKDLYGWFHRPDVDAPAEGGPPVPDAMSAGQRQRNLICPSCRVPCGTSPPAQLFALKGVSDALRTVEQHPATGPVTTPTAHPHPHHPAGDEVVQGAEAHRDEKDKTWGGLWDENGKEPDRLAGRFVVRDHADGVRRCGECNWEIQADGICNGCGRIYDPSDDSDSLAEGSDGMSESEDEGTRYASSEADDDNNDRLDWSDDSDEDGGERMGLPGRHRLGPEDLAAARRENRELAARAPQRRQRDAAPAVAPAGRRMRRRGSSVDIEDDEEGDQVEEYYVGPLDADDQRSVADSNEDGEEEEEEEDEEEEGSGVPGLESAEAEEMSDSSDDEAAAEAERSRIRRAGRCRRVIPSSSSSSSSDGNSGAEGDATASRWSEADRAQYGEDDFVNRPGRLVLARPTSDDEDDDRSLASSERCNASGSGSDEAEQPQQAPARGRRSRLG